MAAAGRSNKPQDTDFKQQRLKAWQPILTPKWVIGTFVVLALIFIPIGIAVLAASMGVQQVTVRYDNLPNCKVECLSDRTPSNATECQPANSSPCVVTINIEDDMEAPVFFYFQLTNFYQNHRRYVKSRSDKQLRASKNDVAGEDIADCDPLKSYSGKTLYPCGLIAGSFFSDNLDAGAELVSGSTTTNLLTDCNVNDVNWDSNGGKCKWVKKGIAWSSDVEKKFPSKDAFPGQKVIPASYGLTRVGRQQERTGTYLPYTNDEDLIVWMRTAGLSTFKKLKRKIEVDLKAGDKLKITVDPNYDVSEFSGTKSLVVATTSWIGGKNDFLGIAYLVVGTLCALLAGGFAIKHIKSPRKLGSMEYFSHWEQSTR